MKKDLKNEHIILISSFILESLEKSYDDYSEELNGNNHLEIFQMGYRKAIKDVRQLRDIMLEDENKNDMCINHYIHAKEKQPCNNKANPDNMILDGCKRPIVYCDECWKLFGDK